MEEAITTQEQPTTKSTNSFAKFIYSLMVIFAVVFVFGIFFGRIVFFPIKVEGISMQPTLNAQAYSKNNCDTVYLSKAQNVSRGDIIVFNAAPYTNTEDKEVLYIKRLIGLPGDTIYFKASGLEKNGKIYYDIYVNGVKMEENYIKEPMWYDSDNPHISEKETEFFLNYVLTSKKITLKSGEYFLMGDNRNNSTDSRFLGKNNKLGTINKKDFVGKVVLQIKSNQTIFEALIQKIF